MEACRDAGANGKILEGTDFSEHAEKSRNLWQDESTRPRERPMNAIKATWINGQVVLDGLAGWPEGRRLVVAEEPSAEIQFMMEEDQRDDPESIQHWID